MILDCALFAGEADLLTLRTLTLKDVVDRFCVVACERTHQGQPVDAEATFVSFVGAAQRAGVLDKAALFWCDPDMTDWPEGARGGVNTPQYQQIERQHRDACLAAARTITTDPDAIVMVSDVDEIPNPDIIAELGSDLGAAMFDTCSWWTLEMRMHSTSLRLLHPFQPWLGTCTSLLRDCAPQEQRDARTTVYEPDPTCGVIVNGGIHASWMGTDDERSRKLATFSHAELADRDLVALRASGQHINGEQLIPCEFPGDLWWPAPLLDGSFTIPEVWL